MSDPIANLISSINNAKATAKKNIVVPASRYKANILNILQGQKAIDGYKKIIENGHSYFLIEINSNFHTLSRMSKSGRRVYLRSSKLNKFSQGFVIISTPAGLMTQKDAKKKGIGGEAIMEVV